MKYRIRKKGNKYVVERLDGNKISSKTLLPEKVWELLECPDIKGSNVSASEGEDKVIIGQSFAQELLNEPSKEEIERTLREISEGK